MNRTAIQTAFSLLSADEHPVHWVSKSPSGQGLVGRSAPTADHLIKHAQQQSGWNFYVSLNPTRPVRYKPSKADITHLCCLGLDIDPIGDSTLDTVNVAHHLDMSLFRIFNAPVHTIYDSGRGVWAWVMVEPTPLPDQAARDEADAVIKGFTRCIAETCGLGQYGLIDTSCAELSRIARCPGTINQKTGRTAEFLFPFPCARVPYAALAEIAAPYIIPTPTISPVYVGGTSVTDIAPSLNATSRQFVLLGVSKANESRHRRLWSTAKNLLELGVAPDTAHLVLSAGASRCSPSLFSDDPLCVDRIITQIWGRP